MLGVGRTVTIETCRDQFRPSACRRVDELWGHTPEAAKRCVLGCWESESGSRGSRAFASSFSVSRTGYSFLSG
jgi:hypothetical protein